MNRDAHFYRQMLRIRRTEERILDLFSEGKVAGTTHTCIGQEANAVGVIGSLDPHKDHVVSNHRCHGHYLAFGGPLHGLMAEITGKASGTSGGRGGSQHLKWGNFFSNGILGGGVPIGCGLALGEKQLGGDGIVTICMGDGTLGEGVLYESLNMAALWSLPVLFLVENNRWAQTTPSHLAVAGSMVERAAPFGIDRDEIETTDVQKLQVWGRQIVERVRSESKPFWAVIHTYRLAAHSKGDDTRPEAEIERQRQFDPLLIHGKRLTKGQIEAAETAVKEELDEVMEKLATDPSAYLPETGGSL